MRTKLLPAIICVLAAVAHGQEGETAARAADSQDIAALWRQIAPEFEERCVHTDWSGLYLIHLPHLAESVAKLLALQLPELASESRPDTVLALTAAGGERLYGIACPVGPYAKEYMGSEGVIVIVGYDGRVRGRPFALSRGDNHMFAVKVRQDEALGDTLWFPIDHDWAGGLYEAQVDGKGIVPLGFTIGEPDELEVAARLSFASARVGRQWKELAPFASQGDTTLLLASHTAGDILRGLYNVENEDPRGLGRAIPFLTHADARVRGRAAAILANDPVACNAVLPLRDDAIPRVAVTAHFAALSCERIEEARTSFIHLLGLPHLGRFLGSRFNYERLRNARVARPVLERVEAQLRPNEYWYYFADGFFWCIDALRRDDLQPNAALQLRIWNKLLTRSDEPLDDLVRVVLRSLVRTEDPATDALVIRYLETGKVDRGVPLTDVLDELIDRTAPLAQAIAPLAKIAEGTPEGERARATLVLLTWRIPEGFQGMPDRLFDLRGIDETLGDTYSRESWPDFGKRLGPAWCRAFTLEQKRVLLKEAIARPDLLAERVAAVLSFARNEELDDLRAGILELWDAMIPEGRAFEALTETLVRRSVPEIDAHMAGACRLPGSPRAATTLLCWLELRCTAPIPEVIAPLTELLARTAWRTPQEKHYLGEGYLRSRWDAQDTRTSAPYLKGPDIDPHLAALLLLVHWRVPGADARLLALIDQERGEPLLHPLFYLAPPLHLRAALKDATDRAWSHDDKPSAKAQSAPEPKQPPIPAHGPWREVLVEVVRAISVNDPYAFAGDPLKARVDLLPMTDRLQMYLRDAAPALATDRPYYLCATRNTDGNLAYLVCCCDPETPRPHVHFVVVAPDGRIAGRPLRVPAWRERDRLLEPSPDGSDAGLLSVAGFRMRIDTAGVVPLGFAVGTRASSARAAQWVQCVGAKPYEDTAALLRSSSTSAIYRGLYNLEFEPRESMRLALPLLAHADAEIRARALAVLANDPELCTHALPFREDPDPLIRTQALVTSTYGADINAARCAFLWLLPRGELPRARYDFPWLQDPRIARVVLATMREGLPLLFVPTALEGEGPGLFGSLLEALPAEALRPHADELLALWSRLDASGGSAASWLGALARTGAPATDALLVRCLRERKVAHNIPFAELLWALWERPVPLPDAVAPLDEIARGEAQTAEDESPVPAWVEVPCQWPALAVLVLQKWKAPGAFERACECIETNLDPDTLRTVEPWGRSWCAAFDVAEKRRLLDAARTSSTLAGALLGIVSWCARAELLELHAEALGLWRSLEGESRTLDELTGLLLGAESAEIDAQLVEDLDDSPRTSVLLYHLLCTRAARPIPAAIAPLTRLAAGEVSLLDDARFYREDCKTEQSIAFLEDPRRTLLRWVLDLPLAASLLLVDWKAPGAEGLLLGVLRKEGPDCFFDILWEIGPPPPVAPALRALAKDYPADCRQRLETILKPRP